MGVTDLNNKRLLVEKVERHAVCSEASAVHLLGLAVDASCHVTPRRIPIVVGAEALGARCRAASLPPTGEAASRVQPRFCDALRVAPCEVRGAGWWKAWSWRDEPSSRERFLSAHRVGVAGSVSTPAGLCRKSMTYGRLYSAYSTSKGIRSVSSHGRLGATGDINRGRQCARKESRSRGWPKSPARVPLSSAPRGTEKTA